MPSRPWRKCSACEWFIDDTGKDGWLCINLAIQRVISTCDSNTMRVIYENGCSEWKSAEPETCGLCHWRKNEQERPNSERRVERCRNLRSDREGQWINSEWGACEHFRRKDAD